MPAPIAVDTKGADTDPPKVRSADTIACAKDFDAVTAHIAENYAGYADKLRVGAAAIESAAALARAKIEGVDSVGACNEVIREWLAAFDDLHLQLVWVGAADAEAEAGGEDSGGAASSQRADDKATRNHPTLTKSARKTLVLRIPSFDDPEPIRVLLETHRGDLRRANTLVVDLRGNGGGSDVAYAGLVDYLYTGPIKQIGADVLCTEANATAWEAIVKNAPQEVRPAIEETAAAMREHEPHQFMSLSSDGQMTRKRVLKRPLRVAVVYDGGCASSCEQFLLAARQSTKVTMFGQPSMGVLDYSNVRFARLPSVDRVIGWPTTRSRRLPLNPVDGIGRCRQGQGEQDARRRRDGGQPF